MGSMKVGGRARRGAALQSGDGERETRARHSRHFYVSFLPPSLFVLSLSLSLSLLAFPPIAALVIDAAAAARADEIYDEADFRLGAHPGQRLLKMLLGFWRSTH